MRDDNINWDAMLLRLKHSLQAIALPAEIQIDLLPDFVCKCDELMLDFDHWRRCVLDNDAGRLSEEQKSCCQKLDSAFENMAGLWTDESLRKTPEWQKVREIAKAALAAFGWDLDRPPSYKREYVRGA